MIRKGVIPAAGLSTRILSTANNAKKIFQNRIEYAPSVTKCISGADWCIIVTEWDEFKELEPEKKGEQSKEYY